MRRSLIILFLALSLGLAACGSSTSGGTPEGVETPAPVPAEYAGKTNPLGPDAAAAGAALFQTNCSPCHGPEGHGDGPAGASLSPAPKNLPQLSATVGDDYLFWRISTGRPGTAMVGWKGVLTDEQIWQLVTYIRTLK
ncbi:MAG: c-type cytochrome [Bacteroidota bacterium]